MGLLAALLVATLVPGVPAGAREQTAAAPRSAAVDAMGGAAATDTDPGVGGTAHREARDRALAAFDRYRGLTVAPASAGDRAVAATGEYSDPAGDVVETEVTIGPDGAPVESPPVPVDRPDADLLRYSVTADERELAFTAEVAAPLAPGELGVASVSWVVAPANLSGVEDVAGVATLTTILGQTSAFLVGVQGQQVVICEGEASTLGATYAAARFPTACADLEGELASAAEIAVSETTTSADEPIRVASDTAPDRPSEAALVVNGPLAIDPAGPRTPVRLADGDRFGTAIEVSAYQFPAGAPVVYLARADAAPDALAGGTLDDGPTLLVPTCDELPVDVREEIERLRPVQVVALGGPLAVCDEVLAAATAAAGPLATSARIGGATRIDTAALIAETSFAGLPPGASSVILASADDYPDALAGGTLGTGLPMLSVEGDGAAVGAGGGGLAPGLGPILLVPPSGPLPDVVVRTIAALAPGTVIALGGPDALGAGTVGQALDVADQALAAGGAVDPAGAPLTAVELRLAGGDRYETAAEISRFRFAGGAVEVFLVTGEEFPDALAGGKLTRGPILLVPSCGELPGPVAAELDRLDPSVVTVLGGPDAVCDATLEGLAGSTPDAGPGAVPAACRGALPVPTVQGRDVRCAFVEVPLDRAESGTATIDLHTAVVPTSTPDPNPDPVVVLGGGPGEKTIPNLLAPLVSSRQLDPTRDLVLVEQRGVGPSRPSLDCPEVDAVALTVPVDATTEQVRTAIQQAIAACYDRLVTEGKDLSAFDTLANAADLQDVAAGLGYDQVNLYGTSYGAKLALQAARGTPGYLRSITLSSPVGAADNFIEEAGPSYAQALDRVFAACEADPACGVPAADLRADIDAIAAAPPLPVPVEIPLVGETIEVPVDAATVSQLVFTGFYSAPAIPLVPEIVRSVADRDPSVLAALLGSTVTDQGLPPSALAFGQQQTFLCAEETAYADPAQVAASDATLSPFVVAALANNAVLGGPRVPTCDTWQVEPADPLVNETVTTTIPTLVVTGTYDQITPPQWGTEIAGTLPNAFLIEATDQGHSPLLQLDPDCGDGILRSFLADPGSAPDASCAERPLVFPSGPAGDAAAQAVRPGDLPVPRPGDLPYRLP